MPFQQYALSLPTPTVGREKERHAGQGEGARLGLEQGLAVGLGEQCKQTRSEGIQALRKLMATASHPLSSLKGASSGVSNHGNQTWMPNMDGCSNFFHTYKANIIKLGSWSYQNHSYKC